ncbi:hypothetical protein HETIRDRAFT_412354 [Heterobasidion irregulare TC 32-1]|uniref:Uncharacterized protein n=1 Tax=Heterobasidion irregulare (strain TC 32-1) TaxID=747525 RepID=W4JRR2_HETIT|nr:uncharacterized protein HETIRDRAFT_412354 [Heterobasidion irregulare TC 32-1]ETW76262.1 hypothetical protein HETIRDRAFT_412354 [Heterobasidion irregulare TC 32-1]
MGTINRRPVTTALVKQWSSISNRSSLWTAFDVAERSIPPRVPFTPPKGENPISPQDELDMSLVSGSSRVGIIANIT